MPALMISYDTIHICVHRARVGHRLERAANMIIINFLTIINIHILTSLTLYMRIQLLRALRQYRNAHAFA